MRTNLRLLVAKMSDLKKGEVREPGDQDKLAKIMKKLVHAVDIKNIKMTRKAISQLSKELMK